MKKMDSRLDRLEFVVSLIGGTACATVAAVGALVAGHGIPSRTGFFITIAIALALAVACLAWRFVRDAGHLPEQTIKKQTSTAQPVVNRMEQLLRNPREARLPEKLIRERSAKDEIRLLTDAPIMVQCPK